LNRFLFLFGHPLLGVLKFLYRRLLFLRALVSLHGLLPRVRAAVAAVFYSRQNSPRRAKRLFAHNCFPRAAA
jgi:hypothetical protein